MANKKYFWLKLKDDFFSQREIKKLRKIAGGDTFTIIYLKMQLLSIKNEGRLQFEGTEKTMIEQLELELDEESDNIEMTIAYLTQNKLIEIDDNDYFLPKACESIGKESDSAERVRRHREKKALQCNDNKLLSNNCNVTSNTEKEKEKEKEIKKDKEKPLCVFFEDIWSIYPNKKNKKSVSKASLREISKIGKEEMIRAIDRYKKEIELKKVSMQYVKHGSTFFNGGYIDYLDDNYIEMENIISIQNDRKVCDF